MDGAPELSIASPESSRGWTSLLGPLVGIGAGVGGYKYLRRFRPSRVPAIRALQRKAEREGAHFLEYSDPKEATMSRLRQWLEFGGMKQVITPGSRKHPRTLVSKGVAIVTDPGDYIWVGRRAKALGATEMFGKDVKHMEARVFGGPGGIPVTERIPTDVEAFLKRRFPEGQYVVKPMSGAKSKGAGMLWGPGSGRKAKDTARILARIKVHPERYIAQEALPKIMGELRVHTLAGRVIPGGTFNRWGTFTSAADAAAAERTVQRLLNKAPARFRPHMYGFDVVKTKRGFRAIESNPADAVSGFPGYYGGTSVLDVGPRGAQANMALSEFVTGRRAPLKGLLGGVGVGGGAGGGTWALAGRKDQRRG